MDNDTFLSPSDLTSGSLTNFIDRSSLDVLRSEILTRKRANCPNQQGVDHIQPLRFKRVSSTIKKMTTHDRRKLDHESQQITKKSKGEGQRKSSSDKHHRSLALSFDEYELSRERMLAKSELYDKLSSSTPLADEDNPFLVDFEKKHQIQESMDCNTYSGGSLDTLKSRNLVFSKAGELVEFVDKFGRTRQCNRKSLGLYTGMNAPRIYEKNELEESRKLEMDNCDADSEMRVRSPTEGNNNHPLPSNHDISMEFCNDQYREKLREKWAEDINLINNSRDVHFEHLRFNEVRDLGAGYFAFSKDAKQREQQLQRFKEMRHETLKAQEHNVIERLRKRSQLDERIRRVRANRGLVRSSTDSSTIIATVMNLLEQMLHTVDEIVKLRIAMEEQQVKLDSFTTTSTSRPPSNRRSDRSFKNFNNFNALESAREEQIALLRNIRDPDFAPPSSL